MASGPRVFIAGAHTYLGARVAAVCQERDFDVIALAHENQETYALEAIGVEIVRGSILEPEGWKNVLKRCDWALNLHRHFDFRGRVLRPRSPLERAWLRFSDRLHPTRTKERIAVEKRLRAINVDGAVNFLDTCVAMDVPKVLTLSSLFAIGDQRGQMADETFEHRRAFRSYYEKTMYDALFQTRRRIDEGAQIACVLPGPTLGPRAEGPIPTLVEDYVAGRLPFAFTGPSQMTFTYIDDLVRGIFQIMDKRAPVGLYIFGNEPITWEAFFKALDKVAGVSPKDGWVKESSLESRADTAAMTGRAPPLPRELLPYLMDCQFRFSSGKAKRDIGWDFTTMEIWMAELVEEIRQAEQGPATQAAIETFRRSALPAGY